MRIAVAIAIAIAVAVLSVNAFADSCIFVPNCDQYGQCSYDQVCSPEYVVEQTVEPDWCLYSPGDQVYVKLNSNGIPVRWYVYYANDNNAVQPSPAWSPIKRFVQQWGGNCFLVYFW